MSRPLRQWIALGVFAFFGHSALRPALAVAAPAAPEATPPPAAAAPAPAPYPPPAPGAAPAPYPAPYYGQYPPPGYAPYPQQYQPYPPLPPPQLVTEHRPRRGLVIGGAILFGVSWGIAASVSLLLSDCSSSCSTTDKNVAEVLWIPIAGPFLAGRETGSSDTPIWIAWSLAELAGATMFVIGVMGHDVTTYKRVAGRGPAWQLSPLLARDTSGMALTARW